MKQDKKVMGLKNNKKFLMGSIKKISGEGLECKIFIIFEILKIFQGDLSLPEPPPSSVPEKR